MPRYVVTVQVQADIFIEAENATSADMQARSRVLGHINEVTVEYLLNAQVTNSWVDNADLPTVLDEGKEGA